MTTEIRDKLALGDGLSILNYATDSLTPVGYSNNGWILSGGFHPLRNFNPDTAVLADLRRVVATLIRDVYGT